MKIIPGSRRYRYVARFSIFLIAVVLIAGMVACGDTTPTVEIRNWYELYAIRYNLGADCLLMNDLDSTTAGYEELASPTANGGNGWQPIGGWDARFTGSFDGRGYEIRNLFINRPDEDDVGLFGAVEQSGVIENISVTNATVIGQDMVGGLVGGNWDGGTVSNSYSSSSVVTGTSHHYHVGGLVGGNEGTVTNSYSTGSVTGGGYVGGLVGTNVGIVSNSYSSSNVTGNGDLIGGLVGMNEGTVTNSYSTGNVTGNLGVGGLVGANGIADPGTVNNSYSTGSVTGESYVGGLVGANEGEGRVRNSYSRGNVSGNEQVGGLIGYDNEGTVSNSFWDTETSGQASSDGGTGKITAEMQNITTFTVWDIMTVANPSTRNPSYTWNIVDDETYPFLSWQP
jgi:hypothetical protein